jgi:hypothetical protein
MTQKKTKTESELVQMIMRLLADHPELRNIQGVRIKRPLHQTATSPNWEPEWVVDGPEYAPPLAWEIASRLQSRFALAPGKS